MKSKNNILIALSGAPLVIVIFGGLFLMSYCFVKQFEKDSINKNISLKEAPILEIEDVKNRDISIYRFLKLDVNKNGVFDAEDVIVKTTNNFEIEKGKEIIYFEDKESNETGVIAYQDPNNNYILNSDETFLNSNSKTKQIFKKFPEYMTDIKQRQ
ncbi:hypothetical protein HDR60_04300 [bacterium]|nr:hypothetical protein [bacterium]